MDNLLASCLLYEYAQIYSPDPLPASALSMGGEASTPDLPPIGLEMLGAMILQDVGTEEAAKDEDIIVMTIINSKYFVLHRSILTSTPWPAVAHAHAFKYVS